MSIAAFKNAGMTDCGSYIKNARYCLASRVGGKHNSCDRYQTLRSEIFFHQVSNHLDKVSAYYSYYGSSVRMASTRIRNCHLSTFSRLYGK